MRQLIEKEPSYYRINVGGSNLVYLSHAINVSEHEILEISIKDIVMKIDALIKVSNALELTIQNMNTGEEFKKLQEENKLLNEKVTALGDQVAQLTARIEITQEEPTI
jgi:predicted nuclease with TOPRIM domain